ncbi:MAG: hypothetical protein FJ382_12745 [Verrucomicrobia bacterium]|nr:hypothetical protein [Verrucomicrobiota bacterium]
MARHARMNDRLLFGRRLGTATLLLAVIGSGMRSEGAPGGASSPSPGVLILRPGERHLFLDDFMLADVSGVQRVMHQPVKYSGNPLVRADRPTDGVAIESRDAPVWDEREQVWKMWYFRTVEDASGVGGAGYARSRDGVAWEKPTLGLVAVNGDRNNNLVTVAGEPAAFIQHVFLDPAAPEDRRFKGFIGSRDRHPIISSDGLTFRRLPVAPIASQDESQVNWDPVTRQYLLTVKHNGPFGRAVYLSLSRDFERWSEPSLIYHADWRDQELGAQYLQRIAADARYWRPTINVPAEYNVDIYNMPVFRYEGVYIGLPNYFESSGRIPPPRGNQDGINSPKLAVSRDLQSWTRVGDRDHFIPISPLSPGALDTGQIMVSSHPVRRGEELWFYYSGINVRYRPNVARVIDEYESAIYLAKLRIDGFVSLRGAVVEGFVDTLPMLIEGASLWINAVAAGAVAAEVTEPDGRKILEGWDRASCVQVTGDHTRTELRWRGRNLAELAGKRVRLRFHLREADLFSFWVQ